MIPQYRKRRNGSQPISPYAVSKLDGEYYCKIFNDEGRLHTASLRYFNVFGERQNPDSQYAAAIPNFIKQALSNTPLTIFGDGGTNQRFYLCKRYCCGKTYLSRLLKAPVKPIMLPIGKKISVSELATKDYTN